MSRKILNRFQSLPVTKLLVAASGISFLSAWFISNFAAVDNHAAILQREAQTLLIIGVYFCVLGVGASLFRLLKRPHQ